MFSLSLNNDAQQEQPLFSSLSSLLSHSNAVLLGQHCLRPWQWHLLANPGASDAKAEEEEEEYEEE